MKIYKDIFKNYKIKKDGIIAIGYFDSFHLGHKKILNELINISNKKNIKNYVLTYDNLPLKNNSSKKLIELNKKLKLFKELGIKNILIGDTNKNFFKLSPIEFITVLKNNFNINEYVIGKDFKFGHKESGSIDDLKKAGCITHFIEPIKINKHLVSTSYIKELIFEGKIEEANKYLGHHYFITGINKKSKQIGRKIGFPTMNIFNDKILYPKNGVYITKTYINNNEYFSMTYVNDKLIESYLLDYNIFKYNLKIKVDFFKKIRDNAHFKDIIQLKKQLEKDLTKVIDYFK